MAMFRALIVLAIASTALGDDDDNDFTVECKSGRPLAHDGTQYAMSHSAAEVIDHGYAKKTQAMSGMMYNVGMMIGFASYAVQGFNVVRDGLSELADKLDDTSKTKDIPWSKRIAAFLIDPNLISFFSSGLSFIVLQDFYARLYQGNPMGVWTVNASALDDSGNLVCQRYGVIADDAEAAMQLGKCHKFPPHVPGCKEGYLSHAEYSVGWGDDECDQKDPVIVQQTLFGGWSATSLQCAFLLGCVLRFFDAVTTFFFDWMKHGLWKFKFGVNNLYAWARKATLEFAMLRGYQQSDIGGIEFVKDEDLGVYNNEHWENRCCPPCLNALNLPNMLDRFGWTAKVISNVASDSLFAVLTMTSLHVSVEDGCISMNTAIGFSALTNVVNIFISTVGLIFLFIVVIVVYHMCEGFYEWKYTTDIKDTQCYFRIFAWCIYFLAVLSIGGFWLNVLSLLLDGDLSAQGCAGIMLEIFGMVGEIAEGYEDERDKDKGDKKDGTSTPSPSTLGNTA